VPVPASRDQRLSIRIKIQAIDFAVFNLSNLTVCREVPEGRAASCRKTPAAILSPSPEKLRATTLEFGAGPLPPFPVVKFRFLIDVPDDHVQKTIARPAACQHGFVTRKDDLLPAYVWFTQFPDGIA